MSRIMARVLVAVSVPAAAFGLLEGALRVAGVAELPPGIEVLAAPDGSVHVHVAAPYSSIQGGATFAARKPPGGFRVAFVGASTTKGIPYAPACSYADFVTARLRAMFPERPIEGVNLGAPTEPVSTSLALARVALEHGADLLVVEAGHNEFLVNNLPRARGRFPAARRFLLDLRITRMIARWVGAWRGSGFDANLRRALGEERERHGLVPPAGRAIRDRVERWFEEDLEAIVSVAKERGAGVVLLIPPARWSGFCPERSYAPPDADGDVDALRRIAGRIAELHDPVRRDVAPWDELLALAPRLAIAEFRRAEALVLAQRSDDARAGFAAAWEDDPTPVGASPRMQRIVADVALRHGVAAADAQAAFEREAVPGLIGPDLLVDHCHPSVEGQFLLAGVVLDAIARSGVLVAPDAWPHGADLHFAPALARLGVDARLVDTWRAQAAFADVSFALISFAPQPYAERALEMFAQAGEDQVRTTPGATVLRATASLLLGRRGDAEAAFRDAFAIDARSARDYVDALLASSPRFADAFHAAGITLP